MSKKDKDLVEQMQIENYLSPRNGGEDTKKDFNKDTSEINQLVNNNSPPQTNSMSHESNQRASETIFEHTR